MANTLLLLPDSRPTAGVLVILALVCQVLADGAGVASLAFGADARSSAPRRLGPG